MSLVIEHHIPCLEVAIQKAVVVLGSEVFGKEPEIGLKLQLVEIQSRSLEEAVLEVIEVEEYAVLIELRLRIAVAPFQSPRSPHLYIWQLTDGINKEFPLMAVVPSASLTSSPDGIEE